MNIMMIFFLIEDFHHQLFLFIYLFIFCMYKIYLISAEEYKNAGVHFLKVKKTGEIWLSMKDVGSGMVVKNISDFVLKEMVFVEQKILQKSKLTITKWQKEKFMKSLVI